MRRLLFVFLIAVPALAQQPFDKLATDAMSTWKFPSLAVAVVQNDRVIYAKGFGVKELGKSDRVSADTLFQIGSTTKAFTTTAMAMLADEKKLDWDDPVRQHIDYFHLADPCADSLVTLRDIVSHRTGLSRHDELWDDSPWTREEILHRVAFIKLTKPIRSAYQYNNIMFMAAGDVVASAGKTSWDDFVRARIFQPLGMTHTRTAFGDWAPSDHATGHRYANETITVQSASDDTNVAPAGSIKSSARDMAQWMRFQLTDGMIDGKRLVSEDALNETRSPQMPLRVDKLSRETNPFTHVQSYAMGWVVQDYRGELMLAHAGALNGFRTQVALLPDRHAGVVVMTNIGRGFGVAALRNAILDALLQATPARDWNAAYLALEKRAIENDEKGKKDREAKRVANTKPSRELASYAGTYHDQAYGDVTITLENDALVLRWSRVTIPLVHYHFDTFTATSEADFVDELVQFQLGSDGQVKSMTLFGEEFVKPSS
ncbi:MAG TPA: serine hydrolase [Thermoanaerobaculia bacterium]|nr:serine hydrolase [Thermoanaerobaculia bacterium]